ncbi:cadherin-like protein 26 [Pygocentrus nattereri]|uniref:cadherin-like protein 26 n=1 Tax=Pygocentrus nattereri TaxID=42514 RepID=UPI0018917408|nr:cadherin-like protein 26 [Pygocentrus nattereri]
MRKLTLALFLAVYICSVAVHSRIRQKRTWIIDSFNIEEENPGPFPYLLGTIELDRKYLVNFRLHGSGVDKEPKEVLKINQRNGQIWVHKKVDYETLQLLQLTFEATNVSNNQVDTRLGVEVRILDINDHAPVFSPPHYQATVDESTAQGQVVATMNVTDKDDSQTPNGTFSFNIISVTPKTDNVEFFLEPTGASITGIFFRGCLDYEKANTYTIVVEAKDHGDKVQLSSTSTVTMNITDKNNHLPEITGQTGPGRVKERESGVEVLRVQVADKDSPGSQAWKAKYTIHGDKETYFKIETDPKTNEGVITVLKAMDYEEQTSRNVSISVANEVPYFSCEITGRPAKRLWDVKTFNEGPGKSLPGFPKLYPVSIAVEDVNDPPEFVPPVRKVGIMENTKLGTHLCTLEAKDPDKTFSSKFHFTKGDDVDNWITVDPETGEVFTAKVLDRESPLLKNSSYSVILYVVDNGEPPMTGTGTLIIQVGDLNDNLPILEVNTLGMCLSDEATMTNITAVDLDLPPYSSPFTYELLGDVKGKWSIDPTRGTTVHLVKENTVYSGVHELQIKVSDNQGLSLTQNLSVTVCDCTSTPNCHLRRSSGAQVGSTAVSIMIFAFLLLLAILLMAFLISCKHEKKMIMTDDEPGWRLLKSNTETLGTDCKVPAKITQLESIQAIKAKPNLISTHDGISKQEVIQQNHQQDYYDSTFPKEQLLRRSLQRNLFQLQAPGEELGDYEPHCYAYEGEPMIDPQLDAISLPENDFNPNVLTNLDWQFNKLASICRPDLML